ncbi:hypothetical protein N0V82_006510 [Gnomoniopsis sp. IMI 355080]|nr:hypothetical protein N0V82_006510 [Gnomoniopsis sp. IMI 355080]
MPAYSEFLERTPNLETDRPYLTHPGLSIGLDNMTFKEKQLPNLVDVRTLADDAVPTLEKEGFQYIKHKSTAADALVNNNDQQAYWAEVTALTKEFLGAETVFPYALKRRGPEQSPPSYKAHCDLPEHSAWPNNLSPILTKEERELVLSGKYRCRVVNFIVWRPLVNHAEDFPLAIMDVRSFDPKDIAWVEAVSCVAPVAEVKEFPTTGTRTLVDYIHYNPETRWYWMSNQTPDEVILFTQWDSHPPEGEDQFNRTVHAAFRNSDAREGCPLRQSVETRMVVLEPAPYQRTKPLPGTEDNLGPWESDTRNVLWAPYMTIDNSSLFNKPTKPGERLNMSELRPREINVGIQKRINVRASRTGGKALITVLPSVNRNLLSTMSAARPLSFMEKLDPLVSVYRPTDTSSTGSKDQQPRLIIVSSWTDAKDAHIAKYVAKYQAMYPAAQIMLLRSTMSCIFRPAKIGPAMKRAAAVVRAAFPTPVQQSPTPPLLIHIFSNGGSSSIANLYHQYAATAGPNDDKRLPMHATIFDSNPGLFHISGAVAFLSAGLSSFQRQIAAPFLYAFAVFWTFSMTLGILPNSLADWYNCHNYNAGNTAENEIRRAYIYTPTDVLTDSGDVERHAAEAKSKGFSVALEKYEGSAHVAHVRKDESRYWEIVKRTVEG